MAPMAGMAGMAGMSGMQGFAMPSTSSTPGSLPGKAGPPGGMPSPPFGGPTVAKGTEEPKPESAASFSKKAPFPQMAPTGPAPSGADSTPAKGPPFMMGGMPPFAKASMETGKGGLGKGQPPFAMDKASDPPFMKAPPFPSMTPPGADTLMMPAFKASPSKGFDKGKGKGDDGEMKADGMLSMGRKQKAPPPGGSKGADMAPRFKAAPPPKGGSFGSGDGTSMEAMLGAFWEGAGMGCKGSSDGNGMSGMLGKGTSGKGPDSFFGKGFAGMVGKGDGKGEGKGEGKSFAMPPFQDSAPFSCRGGKPPWR